MRAFVLSLALLAAAPATASAAFGQVQPVTVSKNEECLGATGRPGEISASAFGGVRFLVATREGFQPGGKVELGGEFFQCDAIAAHPSGAGVIVGHESTTTDDGGFEERYVASIRDPGGTWGEGVELPVDQDWSADVLRAAVSDRGDVLITWRERKLTDGKSDTYRFRAVRRGPGAGFGAPELLSAESPRAEQVTGAITSTGEALVLTTTVEGTEPPFTARVSVSIAAPGAPFGAPVLIGRTNWLAAPVLAVGPDGRALLAMPSGSSIVLAERPPGGTFGAAVPVGDATDALGIGTAAVLGPNGEGSVAWGLYTRGYVQFLTRPTAGAPWTPTRVRSGSLIPAGYDPFFLTQAFLGNILGPGGLIYSEALGNLQLTADGRAAMAWFAERSGSVPALVAAPLSGGPATLAPAGQDLDAPGLAFAVTLGDGTPAIAWTESVFEDEDTRLHLAAEGVVERRDPAPPRVTIGAPRSRRLGRKDPLLLPVACSGPCDVRVRFDGVSDFDKRFSLDRAGRRVLRFPAAAVLGRPTIRPVPIVVTYRTPGAKRARVRKTSVRFARRGESPYAEVQDVRAVRKGDSIRVTWRLKGKVHEQEEPLYVTATKTRARGEEPLAVEYLVVGKRRSFATTLKAGADAKFVTVRTAGFIVGQGRTIVPIR